MHKATRDPITDRFAFTVEEAAGVSTLGRSKLLELVYDGTIRSKLVGRRRLIVASSLRDFIEGGPHDAA